MYWDSLWDAPDISKIQALRGLYIHNYKLVIKPQGYIFAIHAYTISFQKKSINKNQSFKANNWDAKQFKSNLTHTQREIMAYLNEAYYLAAPAAVMNVQAAKIYHAPFPSY